MLVNGYILLVESCQFKIIIYKLKYNMKTTLQNLSATESLPGGLGQPDSANAAGLPATEQPAPQGPRLVYVVENDRISSVITELIVKKNLFGGEVRCYTNGQRAFDELSLALKQGERLPDLVILDLDMPLMDGWEFLDAVAQLTLPHPIKVFVLTSSIQEEDQEKALNYKEVAGFFTKPLKDAGVARMQAELRVN
jgi:CheY-like chemotaxis protein